MAIAREKQIQQVILIVFYVFERLKYQPELPHPHFQTTHKDIVPYFEAYPTMSLKHSRLPTAMFVVRRLHNNFRKQTFWC